MKRVRRGLSAVYPTSIPTLLRAAELLEGDAAALKACHTVRGRWPRSPIDRGAKLDHDEMLSVARKLRALAGAR